MRGIQCPVETSLCNSYYAVSSLDINEVFILEETKVKVFSGDVCNGWSLVVVVSSGR